MKTSLQIAQESGRSKERVNKFAKAHNIPKLGSQYMWDEEWEKAFHDRIGKRGDKLTVAKKTEKV